MSKRTFSRLAAGLVLLTVLFTQVGLNLLHSHLGQPDHSEAALQSAPETSAAPCKVCALHGVLALYADAAELHLPDFSLQVFSEPVPAGILLPAAGRSIGRAPPVS
ncbi:MAG: hypothetical protein JNL40_06180 [Cyclobacteriaceae bacterium]|nr:hypothetical protein [Cyclobacteriaceae bacterium]